MRALTLLADRKLELTDIPPPAAPAAGEASIYVLMFLVLLLRPRGLLGERIEKFE